MTLEAVPDVPNSAENTSHTISDNYKKAVEIVCSILSSIGLVFVIYNMVKYFETKQMVDTYKYGYYGSMLAAARESAQSSPEESNDAYDYTPVTYPTEDMQTVDLTGTDTNTEPYNTIPIECREYECKVEAFRTGDVSMEIPSLLEYDKTDEVGNIRLTSPNQLMSLNVWTEAASQYTPFREIYNTYLTILKEANINVTYKVCYSDKFYVSGMSPDSVASYRHTVLHNGILYSYNYQWDKQCYNTGVKILNNKTIKFKF